jgi:hypothetical protein
MSPHHLLVRAIAGASLIAASCRSAALPASRGADPEGHVYHVYYLGGQSNMEGFGFSADLPTEFVAPHPTARIYEASSTPDNEPVDGKGIWAAVEPGHGLGFRTDGVTNRLSNRFGPEVTFAHRLAALEAGTRVAILKYARGGSSIASGASGYGTWDPDFAQGNGINSYDQFLAAVRLGLRDADIDGDGHVDHLIPAGIVWMQGESDAQFSEASARAYDANLRRLMGLMRTALRDDDLPIVLGRVADSRAGMDKPMMPWANIVQATQARFAETDRRAALVTSTSGYHFIEDGWHYTSRDYVDLGQQFAEAMHRLRARR